MLWWQTVVQMCCQIFNTRYWTTLKIQCFASWCKGRKLSYFLWKPFPLKALYFILNFNGLDLWCVSKFQPTKVLIHKLKQILVLNYIKVWKLDWKIWVRRLSIPFAGDAELVALCQNISLHCWLWQSCRDLHTLWENLKIFSAFSRFSFLMKRFN